MQAVYMALRVRTQHVFAKRNGGFELREFGQDPARPQAVDDGSDARRGFRMRLAHLVALAGLVTEEAGGHVVYLQVECAPALQNRRQLQD
jgi:hypothetical protein